jgi:hypothetical protein
MRARAITREHASSAVPPQRQALELPALESARELTLREAESDDEEGDGTAAVALRSVRSRAHAWASLRACVRAPYARRLTLLCAQAPGHLARFSIAHRVYLIAKARTDDGAAQRVFDALHKSSASIWCSRSPVHAAETASGSPA